jgi:hypothetical protein
MFWARAQKRKNSPLAQKIEGSLVVILVYAINQLLLGKNNIKWQQTQISYNH